MSDETTPNLASPIEAPAPTPAPDHAPVIGYRNIVDDRRPTPWLDLLGLVVSAGSILFFLRAIFLFALPLLGLLIGQRTRAPLAVLFLFALSVTALYLSILSTLTYAAWIRYGRPRAPNTP